MSSNQSIVPDYNILNKTALASNTESAHTEAPALHKKQPTSINWKNVSIALGSSTEIELFHRLPKSKPLYKRAMTTVLNNQSATKIIAALVALAHQLGISLAIAIFWVALIGAVILIISIATCIPSAVFILIPTYPIVVGILISLAYLDKSVGVYYNVFNKLYRNTAYSSIQLKHQKQIKILSSQLGASTNPSATQSEKTTYIAKLALLQKTIIAYESIYGASEHTDKTSQTIEKIYAQDPKIATEVAIFMIRDQLDNLVIDDIQNATQLICNMERIQRGLNTIGQLSSFISAQKNNSAATICDDQLSCFEDELKTKTQQFKLILQQLIMTETQLIHKGNYQTETQPNIAIRLANLRDLTHLLRSHDIITSHQFEEIKALYNQQRGSALQASKEQGLIYDYCAFAEKLKQIFSKEIVGPDSSSYKYWINAVHFNELDNKFTCPISMQPLIFQNLTDQDEDTAVLAENTVISVVDGRLYQKDNILPALLKQSLSPITRETMYSKNLIVIKQLIDMDSLTFKRRLPKVF